MTGSDALIWLARALVAIVATARITRLIVFDVYPPAAWVRTQWYRITRGGPWAKLVDCGYCAAPYVAAVILAWGYWTDWQEAWWIICSWLALSYLAAILISHDGDND